MSPVHGIEPKDPYKIWDFKTLGKRDDAVARKLLEQVTRQVQPIMRKHCWRVPLVTEMFPNNAGLLGLNVNRGQVIKLRLRRAGSGTFLHYESVLGTMLHELCHNEHGPHNASFYKLLDEITAECDDFRARGIVGTGAGFDAASSGRLGGAGFGAHNPDPKQLRDKILKAAAGRAQTQTLMGGGPRRLGGTSVSLPPAQAAAAAAERRARDNVWCPCSHRGEFLSAEDAIIVEDMSTPAPCRSGAPAATSSPNGASGSAPGLRNDARHSRCAAAPQKIVDLTLSDDDDAHPATSQGALALGPGAGASASNAGAFCGVAKESGVAAPELLQNGPKRQRPDSLAKAAVSEAEMSKGQAGTVIQLGASAQRDPGARTDVWTEGAAGGPGDSQSRQEGLLWRCEACTLANQPSAGCCAVCAAPRPAPPPASSAGPSGDAPQALGTLGAQRMSERRAQGGAPVTGGARGICSAGAPCASCLPGRQGSGAGWACRFCTLQNVAGVERCAACDQWKFANHLPTPIDGV